ncbi:MAG TPA: urease accessory protein UreD [Burkholderiaceae bacterium]
MNADAGWLAQLQADYRLEDGRCLLRHEHRGPLRLLKSLYPEGPGICHSVLVHPPSGLVGGDTLELRLNLQAGAHALLTTPGATRYYRSDQGRLASQGLHASLAAGARLEWLPMEAIAYPGCEGLNSARFELAPGAELLAWDLLALGLPGAGQPFERGSFSQRLEVADAWLEQGRIAADDAPLMDGALGLAGQRCLGTLIFAAGEAIARDRVAAALDAVRAVIDAHPLREWAGATAPQDRVLVVRVLAPLVEPAQSLLRGCWAAWRQVLWRLDGKAPRLWAL